uniref:Retrovirus-related Pol polyprotein from transposon TNT 1-94-like beta-barrel domain-containing protein n=1 Tax=Lactuca sativa TaxID=4236 RepID=A0A9R1WYD8_LACSA|nr:hypothetical protein LSAT_V11C800417980 [Lactuca sativa]
MGFTNLALDLDSERWQEMITKTKNKDGDGSSSGITLLLGLDVEFTVIRTQILATKPVPSLRTTYHMVAEDDMKGVVSNENISSHESIAFKAFQRRNGPPGNIKDTKTVVNMTYKEDEEGEWILDSGCTECITYLSNILVNKEDTHSEDSVVILNGDSIPVKGKWDYILPGVTKVNGVLYIPKFKWSIEDEIDWCGEILRGTIPNEDVSRKKGNGYYH